MYVTYFDEVKADPDQGQHSYWVGGICVKMDHIAGLEQQINKIAQEWYKNQELTLATEFHGKALYFGSYPNKNWKPERRLKVLMALVDIIAQPNVVRRVYAKMNVAKLYAPEKAAEYAFAHFCERVQMLVGDTKTLLIGDMDAHQANKTIQEFQQYRIKGTPWEYGIKIPSIIDCVHFAHSHHSRMIQLADIYLFAATHRFSGRKGEMADKFSQELATRDIGPHRYKDWPI
jgi:hypothetical protein